MDDVTKIVEENMRDFQGKGAFITGGASGVGFALARAFGRANMRVMVADIGYQRLSEVCRRHRAALRRLRS
jgi:NAD(P)-dependent dehydrogenase (short-subunit alcohol dehydrogenase family)